MSGPEGLSVELDHDHLSVDTSLCRRALAHVFESEGVPIEQVTLVLCDHKTVRSLNRDYLNHDFETDVLAFRYSESGSAIEGEIYVDLDMALERHAEFDASFEVEALRYAIHGALHLAGHSDTTYSTKRAIQALENRYLKEAGIV